MRCRTAGGGNPPPQRSSRSPCDWRGDAGDRSSKGNSVQMNTEGLSFLQVTTKPNKKKEHSTHQKKKKKGFMFLLIPVFFFFWGGREGFCDQQFSQIDPDLHLPAPSEISPRVCCVAQWIQTVNGQWKHHIGGDRGEREQFHFPEGQNFWCCHTPLGGGGWR